MENMLVNLNQIERVKEFTKICGMQSCQMRLVSGPYVVDAKSILGVFSLDLSKPIELIINTDDDALKAEIIAKLELFRA